MAMTIGNQLFLCMESLVPHMLLEKRHSLFNDQPQLKHPFFLCCLPTTWKTENNVLLAAKEDPLMD